MSVAEVSKLFARQHGVATHSQLEHAGVSAKRRRSKVASEEWWVPVQGLVAVASSPDSWYQRAVIATLCRGGPTILSHSTAARLHRFDGYDRSPDITVMVAESGRPLVPPWVTVHRSRRIDPADRALVEGLSLTTIATTLVHLAGAHPKARVEQALDGVLRAGTSPQWIRETALRWKGSGVSGPALVVGLLDDRVGKRLPRSWFQRLAKHVLRGAGLHLQDEYAVHDPTNGKLLAELDLAEPELRVGVECQSWRWHGSPTAQRRDTARKRRLRQLGWEIADVWWSDLHRPDAVLSDVLMLIERQRKMRTGS